MSKKDFISKVTGTVHKIGFGLKKHSPEILVAAGVVGVVASAVVACKATTKASTILEDAKDKMDKIHECVETKPENEYTDEDAKKDTTIVYVQTGVKLAKLYAPAIILGALSITGIIASNNILRKRNVALAAAYTAVDTSFKQYRSRVVERFGEEIDKELRHNIKAKTFEETFIDENGEVVTTEKTVKIADPNAYSDYARFFDESNPNWEKDSEYNLMFLRSQQAYANDKLIAQGYLYLNDVYDMLGIPRSKAGQIVGWVYNPDNPVGDNYVDFGIYDTNREKAHDFVNGYERSIILDFNVDGNILDLM